MAEEQQQDGQKTLVAFVVGLLIGGMLVWAFSGPADSSPATDEEENVTEVQNKTTDDSSETNTTNEEESESTTPSTPELQIGNGSVSVLDQDASMTIQLDRARYPVSEGWIGVREYNNDKLGFILGVVRFSESQGLVPSEIILQRSTTPGNRYAVVIFTEDGDFDFNLANDVQIDEIFDTFVAQ